MKKTKTVVAEVVNDAPIIEEPPSADAAWRIRFHISEARKHGQCAIAHIIEAGRELALQKQLLGYGQWSDWCEEKLEITQRTADRYIETFQKTVGVARSAQRIGLDRKLLKKELEAATVGMEGKTVRAAMIDLGIIKQDPKKRWGGAGRGQGRKPKGDASGEAEMVELDKVAETASSAWATIRDHLRPLQDAQRDHHVIDHLNLVELAEAHSILKSLCSDAKAALKRLEKV